MMRLLRTGILLIILLIIFVMVKMLFFKAEDVPKDIVIKAFNHNTEQFEYVKNTLKKEDYIIECSLLNDEVTFGKYDKLTDKMVSHEINSNELKQKIKFILKDLGFARISKSMDEVFFVFAGGYDNNVGIRYLITDNKDSHYVYENIKDRWYFTFFPGI